MPQKKSEHRKDGASVPQKQVRRKQKMCAKDVQQREKIKRTKERTIAEIIEKVSTWRKLYYGIEDKDHQFQRWSLSDAAVHVGISKKSLDDYLLQLRFGKKFHFDFAKHQDCKIGKLRLFVK